MLPIFPLSEKNPRGNLICIGNRNVFLEPPLVRHYDFLFFPVSNVVCGLHGCKEKQRLPMALIIIFYLPQIHRRSHIYDSLRLVCTFFSVNRPYLATKLLTNRKSKQTLVKEGSFQVAKIAKPQK